MAASSRARIRRLVVTGALAVGVLGSPALVGAAVNDDSGLYVPKPNHGAIEQIAALRSSGRAADARLIESLIETPQAVWFTQGTPKQVQQSVRTVVNRARGTTAVLVAYNIPFRDCAQFSAGGATTTADYLAWIDGFAAGIGDARAIVILEPDGLGIIPYNVDLQGVHEWCQPGDADPATAVADRYVQMNAAVDRLEQQPNVAVYLDGTHSSWLGSGEAAYRLVRAGVLRAEGFFLNASNYRRTQHLVKYGTWISKCIYFANNDSEGGWRLGHYDWCASQYFPASPNDFSTWGLTDDWYAANVDNATPADHPIDLPHFVIDTSRNGQGPWTPPAGYPDPQDWCNPPGRGTGSRPTPDTGVPLIDAYLWIKIPGESDGQCTRGLGPVGTVDPEWGQVDPAAGQWFPDMALELARNAAPGP
jgi:endoglucanase